jgi:hypothetical protein
MKRFICIVAFCVTSIGCTASQWEEIAETTARKNGTPTQLENSLREKVLAGTATPAEHEVWRSEILARTAIASANAENARQVAVAIASRPPAQQQSTAAPMTQNITQFHDGGITNHRITDMGGGHTTINTW